MRIVKLVTAVIPEPYAVVNVNKKDKEKMFFNIKHGGWGDSLWMYSIGMDSKVFKPTSTDDILKLDRDDYILIPIKSGGAIKKDRAGNDMYFISTDTSHGHKNDILLLWEIPNRNYTNVSYTTSGRVSVLGVGKTGRGRGTTSYVSPAPLLEIFGDCVLTWKGTDDDGNVCSQIVKYNSGNWDIGNLDTVKK